MMELPTEGKVTMIREEWKLKSKKFSNEMKFLGYDKFLETAIQALLGTEYSLQGELLPNYRQEEERQPEHK